MLFADIILPQKLKDALVWSIPSVWEKSIRIGSLVRVDMRGSRKIGIVARLFSEPPPFQTKPIIEHIETGQIAETHLALWRWIAEYYMCSIGEVMQYAYPSFLYPKEERYKAVDKRAKEEAPPLSIEEKKILQLLTLIGKPQTEEQLRKKSKLPNASAAIHSLIQKGYCAHATKRKAPISSARQNKKGKNEEDFTLSAQQQIAKKEIDAHHKKGKRVVLLYGVTGSGKTSIYIEYCKEELQKGNQILFIIPEIELSQQIKERLLSRFPEKVEIYHSKVSKAQREKTWRSIKEGNSAIIVGTRSAIFLPFAKLSLVICDEEHDSSYKQQRFHPTYNAKDSAIMLSELQKAKVILGSATPSIETYYHAVKSLKYGCVSLPARHGLISLPTVHVFDMNAYLGKNKPEIWISPPIQAAIKEAVDNKERILVFQNRRGYAPYAICSACHYIPVCSSCSVRLTFHKEQNAFICHYCNAVYSLPYCPQCLTPQSFLFKKAGTERVEEALASLFPNVPIYVVDKDKGRTKIAHRFSEYVKSSPSILIGTQLISKGFNVADLQLVVVPDFDSLLQFNYFRNNERTMQQLEQVGGRAGRAGKQGAIWIQTSYPQLHLLHYIKNHDYTAFAENELTVRKQFHYPPYCRIIYIECKSKRLPELEKAAARLAEYLKSSAQGISAQGPIAPSISRIKNEYIVRIILKCSIHYPTYLRQKRDIKRILSEHTTTKGIRIDVDVDPM